jgi:hypothetical protein
VRSQVSIIGFISRQPCCGAPHDSRSERDGAESSELFLKLTVNSKALQDFIVSGNNISAMIGPFMKAMFRHDVDELEYHRWTVIEIRERMTGDGLSSRLRTDTFLRDDVGLIGTMDL